MLNILATLGISGPSCDFEQGLCQYTQDTTDNFDWTRQVGSTSSSNTGPMNDHSYGTRYGNIKLY